MYIWMYVYIRRLLGIAYPIGLVLLLFCLSRDCMYVCTCAHMVGLCDNENGCITIMQLIITTTVLHKVHLGMVLSYAILKY